MSPPATTTTVAPLLPAPGSSVAPAPTVLTWEDVSGVLRDLIQAVQEIHLFLAGSYRPHPVAPPNVAPATPWLPWQPPHQAAFPVLSGPLQQPLQLPSIATTAQPWLQWQPPLVAASAAPGAPPQQPLPLPGAPPPVSSGPASTAPAGVPLHQVQSPPSPSPLPSWIATRHVSAAVRLLRAAS